MIEKIVLGWLGIVLSMIYKIPQIYKIYKTKEGDDISKRSMILQSSSYLAWLAYSVLVNDTFFIISNISSFSLNIIIHCMKCYYKKEVSEV